MAENKESWGIIGGGIMGMTLALRLAEKGYDVTVLEASDRPGGLTQAVDMGGVRWDRFYHVILLSDLYTKKIISEIGLDEKLKWVETKTGFFSSGRLYSMSNLIEFLKFPPINLFGKFRLGLTIIAASVIRDGKRMESIPVEKWLKRWSGREVFENIWLPLLKAKLGNNYRETSASFIWTTIQRMYAARRSGMKKEMFGYISGGYDNIIDAFENRLRNLGVNFLLKANISELAHSKNGGISLITASDDNYQFDKVISTIPSDLSIKLAPAISIDDIDRHNSIKYIGVVCPSVLLKRPISEYYVTNIIDSWPPFTGIIEMTALVDPLELGKRSLVYLPKYVSPGDKLFDMDEPELKNYFLNSLFQMYPDLNEDDIVHWTLSKARRVFALPTMNYSQNLPFVKTSIKGYYIINTAQITSGTLNVNETVKVAEEKLEEILKDQ